MGVCTSNNAELLPALRRHLRLYDKWRLSAHSSRLQLRIKSESSQLKHWQAPNRLRCLKVDQVTPYMIRFQFSE